MKHRSTAAPQHRSTAAPQHRSTAAPQHRSSCKLAPNRNRGTVRTLPRGTASAKLIALSTGVVILGAVRLAEAGAAGVVSAYEVKNYSGCGTSLQGPASRFQNDLDSYDDGDIIWEKGITRKDGQVSRLDFGDSALVSGGIDSSTTRGFDRNLGGAQPDTIAYYSGHGSQTANYPSPKTSCTTKNNCTSPYSGFALPGVCANFPPDNPPRARYCDYASPHLIALCPNGTLQWVPFSTMDSSRIMALGESTGNTWAGAGSNGGVNVAVFDMSFPFRAGTEPADAGVFAGLQMWLAVGSNRWGDTAMVENRGAYFAAEYSWNGSTKGLKDAWFAAMWWLGLQGAGAGQGCSATSGVAPGTGINGCGSYVSVTKGATQAQANSLALSTWYDVLDDVRDAKGSGFARVDRVCNYDCATYPPAL